MNVSAPRNVARALAIVAALVFLYWAVIEKLALDWATDENYSHGLLIPIIIAYILWSRREALISAVAEPAAGLGGFSIFLALVALWVGTAGAELFTQRLSLVLILAGIVIWFWGARMLRLLSVPLLLLLLSIPIPAIIFNKIAFPLQLFASSCAVWAMRLFDIPVLRQGNVIELLPLNSLQTKKLEVVEACSGIRSLMTLVTLAVVFAYFTEPERARETRPGRISSVLRSFSFWRALLLAAGAIPIAVLTNALRVSGTGVLAHYYGTEVADGFFHSFSGWAIYILAFLLLVGFGWVLDRLARAAKDRPSGRDGDGPNQAAPSNLTPSSAIGMATVKGAGDAS
jgi:exosortase